MRACLRESEIAGYLEELGASPARRKVEGHLAACARCRTAFDRAGATRQRVDAWLGELDSPDNEVRPDAGDALTGMLCRIEMARAFTPLAHRTPWRPRYFAAALHAAVFALLMFGFTSPAVQKKIRGSITVFDPDLKPFIPKQVAGGGGGGARERLPVTKGEAPKAAPRQFTPPMVVQQPPKLAMRPTIVAPPDTVMPQNNLPAWGDPLAKLMNGSNGNGSGGGMGNGCCGGLGPGSGVGYGPGDRAGVSGEVFSSGANVTRPVVLIRVDPEYSEEARKAKYSGTVELAVIVDREGRARDIRVVKSLGLGLDEKAVEAVAKWKFRPGMRNGLPVNVRARIEVNFRLL